MLKGKIKDFFDIVGGNSGLTEDFIYQNQPLSSDKIVNVYTGSSSDCIKVKSIDSDAKLIKNNKIKKIKFFTGVGIKIVRKGKAGTLSLINDLKYTINDDAYILQVKKAYKTEIDIKYVLYTQKDKVKNCVTSEGDGKNGTFNKTLFEESFIEIPDIQIQKTITSEFEKINIYRNILQENLQKIESILLKILNYNHGDIYDIEQVFDLISEDRRLTEEYIYNNQGLFPVYSAQIDGAYGYINTYGYQGEMLSVVQYGDAGKTTLRKGKFTIGRNACGLLPKNEFKNDVDLRFVRYALQGTFIENSKGSDLKSLSQETIKKTKIFLPGIKTQTRISKEYEKLEKLKSKLKYIIKECEKALI